MGGGRDEEGGEAAAGARSEGGGGGRGWGEAEMRREVREGGEAAAIWVLGCWGGTAGGGGGI